MELIVLVAGFSVDDFCLPGAVHKLQVVAFQMHLIYRHAVGVVDEQRRPFYDDEVVAEFPLFTVAVHIDVIDCVVNKCHSALACCLQACDGAVDILLHIELAVLRHCNHPAVLQPDYSHRLCLAFVVLGKGVSAANQHQKHCE